MIQKKPITAANALLRAEAMCNRAEHCTDEIRRKLAGWGLSTTDIDKIIDNLVKRRFVDDERFAIMFVRDKVEYAGWGRRKIAVALSAKRIPRDIVERAFDEIDEDSYRRHLENALRAKGRNLDDSRESRAKLYRHALSRGYEPSLIIEAMKKSPRD